MSTGSLPANIKEKLIGFQDIGFVDNSNFVLSFFREFACVFCNPFRAFPGDDSFCPGEIISYFLNPRVQPFSVFPNNDKIKIASSGNANYAWKGFYRPYIGHKGPVPFEWSEARFCNWDPVQL